MGGALLRRLVRRLGLTGPARRAVLWYAGPERRVTVDGETVVLEQRDFGDYVELNQIGPEREVLSRLRSAVRPDDVLLDVGSNLGTYATVVGAALDGGEVIAVEPVPATAEKLATNLERNGVDATVRRVAFADEPGTVRMTVPDAHGSAAIAGDGGESADAGTSDDALGEDGRGDVAGGPTVRSVRGDEHLAAADLPRPTVVKVDVEGEELAALRGLSGSLEREDCRIVVCEVHGESPADERERADALRSFLSELGFELEVATELPGHRHVLWAERR